MRLLRLDKLYQFSAHDLGIDLGTANCLVYVKGKGIVIAEPTAVAVNRKTGRLVAIGSDAKRMLGRTPAHLEIVRPLIEGVVSNFEVAQEMLAYFLRRVAQLPPRKLFRPRVVIGVPSGLTNVEVRAVRDAVYQAGARTVHVVEEPMAAAIGIRLSVREPVGHLILDIGGGTADIAVISMGGLVHSKNLRVAGDRLNRDIIHYVRDEFKLLLGEKTAEELKLVIGSVWPQPEVLETVVRGRDLVTGLPKEVVLTDADIREAMANSLRSLVEGVKEVLESTPPEIVSDIVNKGLILTGGGSLILGIKEFLTHELKIPVIKVDDPMSAVVRGAGIILENLEHYQDLLLPIDDELPR